MKRNMEITTVIGCVMNCAFCPQDTLKTAYDNYEGDKILSFENFKKALDKIPNDVRIDFSGMAEPWLNKDCTDMVLYAHEKGHPIAVYTTGVGMTLEDVERIKDLPYEVFVLHLPDVFKFAKHPVDDNYIKVIEAIKNTQIKNYQIMSMGPLDNRIKHIYTDAAIPRMHSRAGHVNMREQFDHGENVTCKCVEHLYHNVLLPNGQVLLCCMDYGMKHVLGNLFEQSYEELLPKRNTCFDLCKKCVNGKKVEK